MPARARSQRAQQARLACLPRDPALEIEGGIRPLSLYVRDGDRTVRPHVALWLDVQRGLIRRFQLVTPEESPDQGVGEALNALVDALCDPASTLSPLGTPLQIEPAVQPGLPALIRVPDPALADAARPLFEPLDVPVELSSDVPMLDAVVADLDAHLGGDPTAPPPEPFTWDIDPAVLPPLYRAAASYARRAPWEYMNDYPPLAVVLGADGPRRRTGTLYGCVLGAAGMVEGIVFYETLAGYRRTLEAGEELAPDQEQIDVAIAQLRGIGVPVDTLPPEVLREMAREALNEMIEPSDVPREDALGVYFDDEEDVDLTYVDWIRARQLPLASRYAVPSFIRTRSSGAVKMPNAREVRALTLALEAVNGFLSRYRTVLTSPVMLLGPLEAQIRAGAGPDRKSIEVRWPGDL